MEPQPQKKIISKVVIAGPAKSGKTSLLLKILDNATPSGEYIPTAGVEFGAYTDGPNKFQIWDTSGQEGSRSSTRSYYKGIQLGIICFDCGSRDQLSTTEYYITEIKAAAVPKEPDQGPMLPELLLVSNFSDRTGDREVQVKEAEDFARKHGLHYLDFSCITGDRDVVKAKLREMLEKYQTK